MTGAVEGGARPGTDGAADLATVDLTDDAAVAGIGDDRGWLLILVFSLFKQAIVIVNGPRGVGKHCT